jgi:hypothetical protein
LNPAGALALKLVLTPVLVGAASLAGRRWGSAIGGWLIGIPFTSGPIAFPLYGSVLAGFAHRIQGAGQAVAVLRGLLLGLFAFFFPVLALLLPTGIALAFGCAITVALLVQGASLLAGRRLGLA